MHLTCHAVLTFELCTLPRTSQSGADDVHLSASRLRRACVSHLHPACSPVCSMASTHMHIFTLVPVVFRLQLKVEYHRTARGFEVDIDVGSDPIADWVSGVQSASRMMRGVRWWSGPGRLSASSHAEFASDTMRAGGTHISATARVGSSLHVTGRHASHTHLLSCCFLTLRHPHPIESSAVHSTCRAALPRTTRRLPCR